MTTRPNRPATSVEKPDHVPQSISCPLPPANLLTRYLREAEANSLPCSQGTLSLFRVPGLFAAVLCGYPLLDMLRYQKFLVGRF